MRKKETNERKGMKEVLRCFNQTEKFDCFKNACTSLNQLISSRVQIQNLQNYPAHFTQFHLKSVTWSIMSRRLKLLQQRVSLKIILDISHNFNQNGSDGV